MTRADGVVELLERLGSRLVPADRVPHYIFGTGRLYGSCPRCGRWDAIHIEGRSWWASCGCFGRPWKRHNRLDALVAVLKIEAPS